MAKFINPTQEQYDALPKQIGRSIVNAYEYNGMLLLPIDMVSNEAYCEIWLELRRFATVEVDIIEEVENDN